jgi:hypothetical protein
MISLTFETAVGVSVTGVFAGVPTSGVVVVAIEFLLKNECLNTRPL